MKHLLQIILFINLLFICHSSFSQSNLNNPKIKLDTLFSAVKLAPTKNPVLIPYRDKNKWGLCDTIGNIIVEPMYTKVSMNFLSPSYYIEKGSSKQVCYIDNNISGFFTIENNNKMGILNNQKEILPTEYFKISLECRTFFTVQESGEYDGNLVFNLKGDKILTEKITKIEEIFTNELNDDEALFLVEGASMSGIFIYNYSKMEIMNWLYKKSNNVYFGIDYSPTHEVIISIPDSNYNWKYYLLSKQNGKNNQLLKNVGEKFVQAKLGKEHFEGIEVSKQELETISTKVDDEPNSVSYISNLSNNNLLNVKTIKYGNANGRTEDTRVLTFVCDSIVENRINHKTGFINKVLEKSVDTVYLYDKYYLIFNKDSTQIIVGDNFIKHNFTSVEYLKVFPFKPFFLVSQINKNGVKKMGVIDADGKYIIPAKFDEIKHGRKSNGYIENAYFIVKENNKFGLIDFHGKEILKLVYDQISSIDDEYYLAFDLIVDGKYGSYGYDKLIEPKYSYKIDINCCIQTQGYQLIKAINNDRKFIGYLNTYGRVYFKD